MSSAPFWSSFPADPRRPESARLRASDADRAVVQQLLTEAYADGRLTRDELDERTTAAEAARTLGDLPPLVDDLVGADGASRSAHLPATREELQDQAVVKYRADRRDAVLGFLGPSLICLVIWAVVMYGEFFWPAFVIAASGLNLVSVLARRESIVAEHVRTLEKRQARELEGRRDDSDESDEPHHG